MYAITSSSDAINKLVIQYKLICHVCVILDALNALEMTGAIGTNYVMMIRKKIRTEINDVYINASDIWLTEFLTKIEYYDIPKDIELIAKYTEMEQYIIKNQITITTYTYYKMIVDETIQQLLNIL